LSHPAQAKEIAARLHRGVLELRPTAPLAPRAVELALGLDHPVYDCFYLALAETEKAELVTADLRLEGRLRNKLWGASVRSL
jgi:predicted nucleic acid-binding protein